MKKNNLATIIILAFLIISCSKSEKNQESIPSTVQPPKVLMNLSTFTGVDEKQIAKDSNYYLNTDYFEIGLYPTDRNTYVAYEKIEKATSLENFKSVTLYISDNENKMLHFKSPTDFMNYLSDRGYEIQGKIQAKKHINYTFKKKS